MARFRKILGISGFILLVIPAIAFTTLLVLQPVGSPHADSPVFIKAVDFLFTYWLREKPLVPPPLIVAGLICCGVATRQYKNEKKDLPFTLACLGIGLGGAVLGLWFLSTIAVAFTHVN